MNGAEATRQIKRRFPEVRVLILTMHENEQYLAKTNQEIADSLVVSIKTVQTHRARMMEKLEAHDRTELVKHAIRLGMITPH